MNPNLGLSIIASLLIIIQFVREIITEENKKKITLSEIILILTLVIFWGSFFIQVGESNKQEKILRH